MRVYDKPLLASKSDGYVPKVHGMVQDRTARHGATTAPETLAHYIIRLSLSRSLRYSWQGASNEHGRQSAQQTCFYGLGPSVRKLCMSAMYGSVTHDAAGTTTSYMEDALHQSRGTSEFAEAIIGREWYWGHNSAGKPHFVQYGSDWRKCVKSI